MVGSFTYFSEIAHALFIGGLNTMWSIVVIIVAAVLLFDIIMIIVALILKTRRDRRDAEEAKRLAETQNIVQPIMAGGNVLYGQNPVYAGQPMAYAPQMYGGRPNYDNMDINPDDATLYDMYDEYADAMMKDGFMSDPFAGTPRDPYNDVIKGITDEISRVEDIGARKDSKRANVIMLELVTEASKIANTYKSLKAEESQYAAKQNEYRKKTTALQKIMFESKNMADIKKATASLDKLHTVTERYNLKIDSLKERKSRVFNELSNMRRIANIYGDGNEEKLEVINDIMDDIIRDLTLVANSD